MAKVEKKKKKPKAEPMDVEEYFKQLPPPPEEHAHELKMEKRLTNTLNSTTKRLNEVASVQVAEG